MNKKMNNKMNNKMNKYTCLISIFILATLLTTQANAEVDSSFTYQGELQDNNSPANDAYDFLFNLTDSGGFPFGDTSEHLNTDVVNGLFSLNVDFNIDAYDGFGDVSFSIEVRKSSDGGAYTSLGSQTIQSVPLATSLTNGDAMTGEVLTFNGFQWAPITPAGSPWALTGSNLSYLAGDVAIGTTTPLADLTIDGTTDGNLLRVRVNSTTKFLIDDNGGASIGSISVPPVDGLDVEGDVKQPLTSNGMMKYMVHASCGGSNPQSIVKSYNGVSQTAITLVGGATIPFSCRIKFPAVITSRYFQVTSIGSAATTGQGATCRVLVGIGEIGDTLECLTFRTDTGAYQNGSIMVLVY